MQRSLRNALLRFAGMIVFCWAFSCLCGTPAAQAEKYGSVTVNHIPLYETHEATRRGYAGYLFQIQNAGETERRVRIEWPSSSSHARSNDDYLFRNERTVKVGRAKLPTRGSISRRLNRPGAARRSMLTGGFRSNAWRWNGAIRACRTTKAPRPS